MLIAMILAAALSTQPASELPKHWNEFPDEITTGLFNSCVIAGKVNGHDKDKMDGYCTCHIWIMTEITPYKDFLELKNENKLDVLFGKASVMCINMGFRPGPPKQKAEPRPTNPLKTRPGTSVT